eukprot:scaffold17666_cov66-Phaeocystis_antarctica.AAC.1
MRPVPEQRARQGQLRQLLQDRRQQHDSRQTVSATKLKPGKWALSLACLVLRHAPSPALPPPPRNARRYVKVLTTLNGVLLSADRRGHQGFSNTYWKRAPPAEANTGDTDTSDFFIEIKSGFQFVITDMHNKS